MWGKHLTTWLDWLSAGGAPRTTIELRKYQLGRLARDHADRSPWALEVSDLSDWLASHDWSRETLRSYRGQELLGHASVATTQIYTKVADGALRAAVHSAAS